MGIIICFECNKQFKSLITRHLTTVHKISKEQYLERYPDAMIISDEYRNNLQKRTKEQLQKYGHPMQGRMQSEESKRKSSETHKKLYIERPELKEIISQKTKEGMHKKENWDKFKKSIEIRSNNDEWKTKLSFSTKERFANMDEQQKKEIYYSEERNEKVSKAKKEWWKSRKGKTPEEIWGEETGKRVRKFRSERAQGEKNPAYGKTYEKCNGGKSGRYKGLLFRGIWEYSYWRYLENLGFNINDEDEIKYEPFKLSYISKNRKRTYTPDFLNKKDKILIEVKSFYKFSEMSEELQAKKQVAEKWCQENGHVYHILTEKDFPVLSYAQAYADSNIEWIKK